MPYGVDDKIWKRLPPSERARIANAWRLARAGPPPGLAEPAVGRVPKATSAPAPALHPVQPVAVTATGVKGRELEGVVPSRPTARSVVATPQPAPAIKAIATDLQGRRLDGIWPLDAAKGKQSGPTGDISIRASSREQVRTLSASAGLGGIWHSVTRDASRYSHRLVHEGSAALRLAEGAVESAGTLIARSAEATLKTELTGLEIEAKFGREVAKFVEEHPAAVATVAATAAIFVAGPAGVALAVLAVSASLGAGAEEFRKRNYVEGALDIASAFAGAGSLGARVGEGAAEFARAGAASRLETLTEEISNASADDIPSLNPRQQRALEDLVQSLDTSRKRAAQFRRVAREADMTAAVLALLGDPHTDPALDPLHR